MAISFKGAHFPTDIILMGVRWYVAYPLSYRHVEELLEERRVPIDHATIQRWGVKYSPQLPGFSANNSPAHAREKARKSLPGAGLRADAGVRSAH